MGKILEEISTKGFETNDFTDAWLRLCELKHGIMPRPYTTTTTKKTKTVEDHTVKQPNPTPPPVEQEKPVVQESSDWLPTLLGLGYGIGGGGFAVLALMAALGYFSKEPDAPKPVPPIISPVDTSPSSLYQYIEDLGAHVPHGN